MAGLSTDTFNRLLAIIRDEGVRIPVGRSHYAVVDEADAEMVSQHHWIFANRGYALTKIDGCAVFMHRMIMGESEGCPEIDHEDGDGLNNRRHNLRFCTRAENAKNRHSSYGKSKFKGVWRDRYAWRATIWSDGRKISLGSFVSERKAAKAYDRAAKEYHGQFACTNEDLGLY